jgi:hypothetical protein
MSEPEELPDPFELHIRREPLPGAGVRVIVLSFGAAERARTVADSLVKLLSGCGRPADSRVVEVEGDWRRAIERGLDDANAPLVLVTTAVEPWSRAHIEPLLEAIDRCDHVVGRRKAGLATRLGRRLSALWQRTIFAVPVQDVHSPCRLHRLEKLAVIPLQSRSAFLNIEILAKATFFGHLIDEVRVPPLATGTRPRMAWSDLSTVFRAPTFTRVSSGPSEDAQGDEKGDDSPGSEDDHGRGDVEPASPFEDHPAQGADELSQGEGLDERLSGGRESIGREEDPREEPHRQHDQVHQAADRLGGLGPAGDQQTDPGKGERPKHIDHDHQEQVAPDRHLEGQRAEQQEDEQVGDQEREAGPEQGEEEVAPGHRSRHEAFEQLGDPEIHQEKPDPPEPAPHRVQPDEPGDQEVNVS